MIHIDGERLDQLLAQASPEDDLEGLVPVLMPWIEDTAQQTLCWQRFLPSGPVRQRTPVLMCPEHRNLYCTTIIAEVKVEGDTVQWRRLGIDDTPEEDLPELVGQDVYWLRDIGPYEFSRVDYMRMMDAFRRINVPSGTLH